VFELWERDEERGFENKIPSPNSEKHSFFRMFLLKTCFSHRAHKGCDGRQNWSVLKRASHFVKLNLAHAVSLRLGQPVIKNSIASKGGG
jgi:hypothetical protein